MTRKFPRSIPLLILIAAFASGCSTAGKTYHGLVGARADNYTEKPVSPLDTTLAQMLGGTVTTTQGDSSKLTATGIGGQVGLTEQSGKLISTLSVYYVKYNPITYGFNSSSYGQINETLNITGYGFDGTLGWDLGIFRPGVSYKYESQKFDGTVSGSSLPATAISSNSSTFMLGGGLALDIPLSQSLRLVAQGDYRIPLSKSSSVDSANSILGQVSLRFGGWKR